MQYASYDSINIVNSGKNVSLWGLCILGILIFVASGCSAPPIQTQTSLDIKIIETGFDPDILYVPTDTVITVTITNTTSTDHEWIVLAEPYFNPFQTGEPEVYYQVSIPAGEKVSTQFQSPMAAIELDVICESSTCISAGLRARLVIVNQ